MEKVIIITHGNYGEEIIKSVEMIVGKQDNAYSFSIKEDTNIEDVKKDVGSLIDEEAYIYIYLLIFMVGHPLILQLIFYQKKKFILYQVLICL